MTFSPYNVRFKPRIFEGFRISGDPRIYPEPHLLFPDLQAQCESLGLSPSHQTRAREILCNKCIYAGDRARAAMWAFAIDARERMLFSTALRNDITILPADARE